MKNGQLTLFNIDSQTDSKSEPTSATLVELSGSETGSINRHIYNVNSPQRLQYEVTINCIDDLIPEDHRVRIIWEIIKQLNLDNFFRDLKVLKGGDGRPATDPYLLLALWIYAIIEGISSARTLARYCKEHLPFIWLCGGVSVNYHTLSDFRNQEEKLDQLFVEIIASLIDEEIVSTEMWAQDGMRVRADAGKSSFRREKSLKECKSLAERRIKELKKEGKNNPMACSIREKAARERAAKEKIERTNKAINNLKELRKTINNGKISKKDKKKRTENARASTTDPEARTMKMPNGGFNPGYNFQFVSDTKTHIILGIDVINSGNDGGQLIRMVNQVQSDYSVLPDNWGIDGGYYKQKDIETLLSKGCLPIAPIPEHVKKKRKSAKKIDAGLPLPGCSEILDTWIERMETEEMKKMYRKRASTAECVNADARNRGLYKVQVRGKKKVKSMANIFGLAHNFMRLISLCKDGIGSKLCPT